MPDAAILRRRESGKWFAVFMVISRRKLGLPSAALVEAVNLHATPGEVARLVDDQAFLPAFHMNKIHWFSATVDETVATETLLLPP